MFNIVLCGPPGAGKGTQARELLKHYDLGTIAPGTLFRKHIREKTPLGLQVQQYVDHGHLVPNELVTDLVAPAVRQAYKKHAGLLFDGYPRTQTQAQALDALLEELGTSLTLVVLLELSTEVLKQRIQLRSLDVRRVDDQDEALIARRVAAYEAEIQDITHYYEQQGKLFRVPSDGYEVPEVFALVQASILKSSSRSL